MVITSAVPEQTEALVALAVSTGLFTDEEADVLLRTTLSDLHAGKLGAGHQAAVALNADNVPLGWVYFGPHDKADGVWELWWIGVAAKQHRKGTGSALMLHVENSVRKAGGRLLIVETSSTPQLVGTRQFYVLRGYRECGTIPDYYGEGDGKVTFVRNVTH